MTEEETSPPDGGDVTPLAGKRLAEARNKRAISVDDIARQLHLDEHKVRALEQNEFDKLGAPVFTKGYLKKYAELVGVPVDDVLGDYYRLNRSVSTPLVIPRRAPPPRDISPGPWLGVIAAVVIVAGAAWWWLSGGAERSGNGTEPATLAPFAEEPVDEQPPAGEQAAADASAPGTLDAEGLETSDPSDAVDGEAPTQAAPPSGDPGLQEVELRLTFSGDCWTEVTDALGDRLYFGLGSAGRAVTVSGEPPLQVLLGNAANVTLDVNGSNFPIPASARRGDTARLTIINP